MATLDWLSGFAAVQHDLARISGLTKGAEQIFEASRAIGDIIDSPALRAMRETNEKMGNLLKPVGIAAAIVEHQSLSDKILPRGLTQMAEFHDKLQALCKPVGLTSALLDHESLADKILPRGLAQMGDFHAKVAGLERMGGALSGFYQSPLFDNLRTAEKFDRTLCRALPELYFEGHLNQLRESATSSLSFLSEPLVASKMLLSGLEKPFVGASAAWAVTNSRPRLGLAALVENSTHADTPAFEITVEVVCAICEKPMFSPDEKLRWVGPRHGVLRTTVFPFCATCMAEAAADPTFFKRALDDLQRPKLKVIRGDGNGPDAQSRERGHLRLVSTDVDDSDEPND